MVFRKTIALFLFLTAGLCAQSVFLPLDHWAYDFIDRMETRGVLHHIRNGSRPFTRERCSLIIRQLDEQVQNFPEKFSSVEKQMVERLKGEFWGELQNQGLSIQSKEKEPHFYARNFEQGAVSLDALTGYSFTGRTADAPYSEREIQSGYYGVALRGNAGPVGFYSDDRIYSEWGSREYLQRYNASDGYPLSTNRDNSRAIWDVSDSYLTLGVQGIQIQWGRDNVRWGPLRDSGLMLSGSAPSFDLLKLHFDLGPGTFTWLHGELRSDFSHKWIAAHRLELSLSNSLDLGLQEVVIYGNRGLETAYLNPVLPYLVAQHTLGDRDNMSLGLDFDFHHWNNLKFRSELFIDDLFAPWEILNDFWGNKLAFGLGMAWVNPLGLEDSEFGIEYVRIEPFVYTHDDPVNVFEHYASGLGHTLQPNSDRFRIEASHRFSLQLQAAGSVSVFRHGTGDKRTPHTPEDGETKSFLDGTVERIVRSGCEVKWEPVRDLRFRVSVFHCNVQNPDLVAEIDRVWTEGYISLDWNW